MNAHVSPTTMVADAAPRRSGNIAAIRLLELAVVVTEIVLLANALTGDGWTTLALGHLGLIAGLVVVIIGLEWAQIETSALQTFALLSFAGGPIGGVAALFGQQQLWQPGSAALDKWYDTIAPVEAPAVTLVDMIIDGRLVRQQSRLPRPYDSLLSTGTMQEKQALLAYLAIEDDEKFVEVALALALRSPDQRVRVQAAAVAAHTRARSRRRELGPAVGNVVKAALSGPPAAA